MPKRGEIIINYERTECMADRYQLQIGQNQTAKEIWK